MRRSDQGGERARPVARGRARRAGLHGRSAAIGWRRAAARAPAISSLQHALGFLAARHAAARDRLRRPSSGLGVGPGRDSRTGRNPAAAIARHQPALQLCGPRRSSRRSAMASDSVVPGQRPSSGSPPARQPHPAWSTRHFERRDKPAKKPLSQARCSVENGAFSGISARIGRCAFMQRSPERGALLAQLAELRPTSWRRANSKKDSVGAGAMRELGLQQASRSVGGQRRGHSTCAIDSRAIACVGGRAPPPPMIDVIAARRPASVAAGRPCRPAGRCRRCNAARRNDGSR